MRAQITVFMVLGFLILAGFSLYFLVYSNKNSTEVHVPKDLEPYKQAISDCLEVSLSDTLDIVSYFGGGDMTFSTYYHYQDGFVGLTEAQVKEKISEYYPYLMQECINNQIPKTIIEGIGIEGSFESEVMFSQDELFVIADVLFPLTLSAGGETVDLQRFNLKVRHTLPKHYAMMQDTLQMIKKDMSVIPLSELTEYYGRTTTYYEITQIRNGTLFRLIDNRNTPQEVSFAFLVVYPSSEEVSSAPVINTTELHIPLNYPFTYTVQATGTNLEYFDRTDLFNITPEGIISFTPTESDRGIHRVLIGVTDKENRSDICYLTLHIGYENKAPVIEDISDAVIHLGETFTYQVVAYDDDDALFFRTNLGDNSIGQISGLINYTPIAKENRIVTVTVMDIFSNAAEKSFVLQVIE
jgi:archaellin